VKSGLRQLGERTIAPVVVAHFGSVPRNALASVDGCLDRIVGYTSWAGTTALPECKHGATSCRELNVSKAVVPNIFEYFI